jgi:hypothetical protein
LCISGADALEGSRLAKECDRDEAVDWSWDCMLFMLLSALPMFPLAFGLLPASVFRRRSTPETAYDMGYVKYDVERVGAERELWGDECEPCVVGCIVSGLWREWRGPGMD